ncbi:MAG: peptidase S10 [Caldimonas sp.]
MADAPAPNQESDSENKQSDKKMRERVDKLIAQTGSQSRGAINLGGKTLDYRVDAAFLPVVAEGFDGVLDEPQAAVMATSYALEGVDSRERPVCFAFNGGPGSASIWLHLGALGPKRVSTPDDASMPSAPFVVVDNPHSWFEHFDLVFIDPPHTGWSTSASVEARKKMLSVDGDVTALTEVMRVWLTRHRRWSSPVYLAGESYGTTRGAALADKLLSSGVALAGLILISCAMDLQSIVFAPSNDLPYSLFLPAFANVSQYHGLLKGPLGASPEAARAAAESFVDEDYVAALQAGARLSDKRRARVARRIAELTGLSQGLIEEKNLRIADGTYFFEALRSRGRIVGRLEARATGPMAASRTREWEFDPGIEAIAAPYTMAAMAYFGEHLGMSTETRYEVLSHDVHKSWNWNRGDDKGNSFASTSPDLARALRRNQHLKVFVGSGRYDLGTPYSASDWSLAQLDAPADVLARVRHHYYDAGHMMYTREADLIRLKADIAAWLDA